MKKKHYSHSTTEEEALGQQVLQMTFPTVSMQLTISVEIHCDDDRIADDDKDNNTDNDTV